MKVILNFTITFKDGKVEKFDNVVTWEILDKFLFICERGQFKPSDSSRGSLQKHWWKLEDITMIDCDDERFFENKKERKEFADGQQIKLP